MKTLVSTFCIFAAIVALAQPGLGPGPGVNPIGGAGSTTATNLGPDALGQVNALIAADTTRVKTNETRLPWVQGDYGVLFGRASDGNDFTGAFGSGGLIGVGKGNTNTALASSMIASGDTNSIVAPGGTHAFIGGGLGNFIIDAYIFIGGGSFNYAEGNHTAVVGGERNRVESNYAFVGGGATNRAAAEYSTILAGKNNYAAHSGAMLVGNNLTSSVPYEVKIGISNNSLVISPDGGINAYGGSVAVALETNVVRGVNYEIPGNTITNGLVTTDSDGHLIVVPYSGVTSNAFSTNFVYIPDNIFPDAEVPVMVKWNEALQIWTWTTNSPSFVGTVTATAFAGNGSALTGVSAVVLTNPATTYSITDNGTGYIVRGTLNANNSVQITNTGGGKAAIIGSPTISIDARGTIICNTNIIAESFTGSGAGLTGLPVPTLESVLLSGNAAAGQSASGFSSLSVGGSDSGGGGGIHVVNPADVYVVSLNSDDGDGYGYIRLSDTNANQTIQLAGETGTITANNVVLSSASAPITATITEEAGTNVVMISKNGRDLWRIGIDDTHAGAEDSLKIFSIPLDLDVIRVLTNGNVVVPHGGIGTVGELTTSLYLQTDYWRDDTDDNEMDIDVSTHTMTSSAGSRPYWFFDGAVGMTNTPAWQPPTIATNVGWLWVSNGVFYKTWVTATATNTASF